MKGGRGALGKNRTGPATVLAVNFSCSKLSFHWHQKIFVSGKTLQKTLGPTGTETALSYLS
jgi:hypothetical protein